MKKFWNDFKAFAMKGNVVDMAVGVVVGSAFSKIVSSFVADVITPLLGVLLGKISIADLKWVIKEAQVVSEAVLDEAGNVITPEVLSPEVAMTYGVFIQAIIDFFIIALSLFIVLRIMMKVKDGMNHKQIEAEAEAARIAAEKKAAEEAEAAAKAAEPSEELKALLEIRDLLKKQ